MNEGLCLVVSPLISLMKDQVQQLRNRGIKAACLVSGTTTTEQQIVLNHCLNEKVKLLYVSPERLRQRVFIEHFRRMKVSLIAVDEAHCISQWGHDFRPSFLQIADIRAYHPTIPVVALTASATPKVAEDICRQLLFRPGARRFKSSYSRTNLSYRVYCEEDKMGHLIRVCRQTTGSGIVYVRNRRRTAEVAKQLSRQGITSTFYHAGLPATERDNRQRLWMEGQVRVIVSTNAFGMGIDKADVRFVVHLDIPNSIEAYYQEAGRAGRDGKLSYALLLYDDKDLENLHNNFQLSYPSRETIGRVYRAICNYYQVPIGSGCGSQFDFDMEDICRTYKFQLMEFFSSVGFLEREGLIALPEQDELVSRLYVAVNRDTLSQFVMDQPRYADLMTLLLRMYGGVCTEYVHISEREIARRLLLDEETVVNRLLHLDALKVVSYQKKNGRQQIVFTSPRVDDRDLYLSDANYKHLKEEALHRMDAIRQYVGMTAGCRNRALVSYFGEADAADCHLCDLCHVVEQSVNVGDVRKKIIDILRSHPQTSEQLLEKMSGVEENTVKQLLRQLVDENEVSINQKFQFFV